VNLIPLHQIVTASGGHATWFNLLLDEHTAHNYNNVLMGLVVLVLIVLVSLVVKAGSASSPDVPPAKTTFLNFWEMFVEGLFNIVSSVLGEGEARRQFWFFGSIFLYLFFSNALGLIPGFLPSTDNLFTNFPVALSVFIYYNYMGIKSHGLKNYLAHFWGPLWWLGPLLFVIEIVSHSVRPVSLSLRLYANIFGDHKVLGAFQQIYAYVLPVPLMAFGLFVSLLQAYVFTYLSMIYVALATEHEGGHDEHGHDAHGHDAHGHHEKDHGGAHAHAH